MYCIWLHYNIENKRTQTLVRIPKDQPHYLVCYLARSSVCSLVTVDKLAGKQQNLVLVVLFAVLDAAFVTLKLFY